MVERRRMAPAFRGLKMGMMHPDCDVEEGFTRQGFGRVEAAGRVPRRAGWKAVRQRSSPADVRAEAGPSGPRAGQVQCRTPQTRREPPVRLQEVRWRPVAVVISVW